MYLKKCLYRFYKVVMIIFIQFITMQDKVITNAQPKVLRIKEEFFEVY